MSNAVAWALFILGIAHVLFGMTKFKGPLAEAVASGFAPPQLVVSIYFDARS